MFLELFFLLRIFIDTNMFEKSHIKEADCKFLGGLMADRIMPKKSNIYIHKCMLECECGRVNI